MPWDEVEGKWGRGELRSGGSGHVVPHTQAGAKQMYAIKMSEKRAAAHGKKEYAAKHARRRGQRRALA